ncbi:MAG: hypothetical protein CMJ20_13830 [Phycisphaeraceae bacterium]|nr:hypothetical protein [Phycisphaeraceae bacterium]
MPIEKITLAGLGVRFVVCCCRDIAICDILLDMAQKLDCVVCGSCVVDLLCRPVHLDQPIGAGVLHETDSVVLTGGGITLNAGVTMARLGMRVGLLSYVGNDAWAPIVQNLLKQEGIDDKLLSVHPTGKTSTTVVVIDQAGERSFFHCVGAPKLLDADALLEHLDVLAKAKMFLLGYYSLMPNLERQLPDVLKEIRAAGCKTALDTAGTGGGLQPLDRILPHLDIYVPSVSEAKNQTGIEDPRRMIDVYRDCGAPGLLGVKLGMDGVLLSPSVGEFIQIPITQPDGTVIDTTGAGDSFYAGLLTGLIQGLSVQDAGRLGSAAAACCVTAIGGATGGRNYAFTSRLAGLQ